jgi:hypothetical protein
MVDNGRGMPAETCVVEHLVVSMTETERHTHDVEAV